MGKFISWYQEPRSTKPIEYLADAHDGEGYIYVTNLKNAKRFDTREAAEAPTPVYDGSADIVKRAGVYEVFDDFDDLIYGPNRARFNPYLWWPWIAAGAAVIAYFVWQFCR